MEGLLHLEAELTPHALAAGFEATDRELADNGPEWLEYCRAEAAGKVLLSLTHAPEARTIIAELWRPERLAEARHGAGPQRVAERYATWRYGPEAGPGTVESEVAATVSAWLAGFDRPGQASGAGQQGPLSAGAG